MRITIVLFLTLTFFMSCMSLKRSEQSGYSDPSAQSYKKVYKIGERYSHEQPTIMPQSRLRDLEKRLDSKREREQYSKVLPWLKSEDEKIEFLSLPSIDSRQEWINSKKIWQRSQLPTQEYKDLIESQDIAIGMPMDFVRKAWGEPQAVDYSGSPTYKNERWKYTRHISTAEGFKQEKRFVYFEGGRVVGWETE